MKRKIQFQKPTGSRWRSMRNKVSVYTTDHIVYKKTGMYDFFRSRCQYWTFLSHLPLTLMAIWQPQQSRRATVNFNLLFIFMFIILWHVHSAIANISLNVNYITWKWLNSVCNFGSREHSEKSIEIMSHLLPSDHILFASSKRVKGKTGNFVNEFVFHTAKPNLKKYSYRFS